MKQLSLTKPHAIVMVGVPGSGKTFFAEKFADTFRAPFISQEKLASYAPEAAEQLADYMLEEFLKTGQSIVIEGRADTRVARLDLARKVKAAGYSTLLVWVQTDLGTAKMRSMKNSGISAEEFDKLAKRFTPPTAPEKPVVISGKHTYATQAKVILQRLSAPRAEISTHPTPAIRPEERPRRSITIR